MDLFRTNPGFAALVPMARGLKCVKHDANEVNYAAGFFNLLAASLAITALMYSDFILIEDGGGGMDHENRTLLALENLSSLNTAFVLEDSCERIGAYYFWRPARFGTYDDASGKEHVVYHYEDTTLVDCISPTVANLFYIIIALCFVIIITSSFGAMMNIIGPSYGFLQWLRQNTVLEICNMAICLITCIVALFAQLHIANLRPWSSISVSTGVFLIGCSGIMSFVSSAAVLRSKALLQRARRIDNQRLLCHRSLRSWRDVNNRIEDTTPIIQFERYLMQSSVLPSDDSFEPTV